MRKTYRKKKPVQKNAFKKNEDIKSPELLVFDDAGNSFGVMSRQDALDKALEFGADLVEVSPKAQPPVAKLMDYGKFIYQKEKQLQKQKTKLKKVEIKGVRLSLRISEHDLEMKKEQAKKFIEKGHKAKIEMTLKGREHQHTPMAKERLSKFVSDIATVIPIETELPIQKQGGKVSTIIFKKN